MIQPFVSDTLPARIVFGAGSFDAVGDEVAALGLNDVLLISSPSNADVAARAAVSLGSRAAGHLGEVQPHVPQLLAMEAVETAKGLSADGLVVVGGGSAIGLAKAVALDLSLPIVAVPTTYSGSELTATYSITAEHTHTGRDPRVAPYTVIYDPVLTCSLPPQVTAASGCNALAHAVEATYLGAATPVSTLLAVEAVRVLARALPRAVDDADDLEVRTEALYGAYLAALVLSQVGTGLHHQLCDVLGGTYGLGHADVHAVLLPHIAAYNQPAAPQALGHVAAALEARDAAGGLRALARRIGAPIALRQLGLDESNLDAAADAVAAAFPRADPRPADAASLRSLLDDAYRGRPPRAWDGDQRQPAAARP